MANTDTMEDRWAASAGTDDQGPATGLTPHLTIREGRAAEAVKFYEAAFGATEAMRMTAEDGVRLMHCHLRLNGGSLMLADDWAKEMSGTATAAPSAVTLHLQVDDADAWFNRATDAGATPTMPPQDVFWGDRYGQLVDPFGHTWAIASPIKQ